MASKIQINQKKIGKKKFEAWLNTAIWFSVWLVSDKTHVKDARDFIFDDIGEKYYNSKDKSDDKRMLMTILLNLWVGLCSGSPVMIYRNKNKYGKNSAYHKVFFQYDRTIRLLDKLIAKGYLEQKKGYFDREDGCGRVTRIWGTEKLLRLFIEEYNFSMFDDIYQEKNIPLVQLNHKEIKEVFDKKTNKWIEREIIVSDEFDDTDLTLEMEYNLRRYNALGKNQTITIKISEEDKVKPKILTEAIIGGLITGAINFINSELNYKDPSDNQCYGDQFTGSNLPVFSKVSGLKISQFSHNKFKYNTIDIIDNDDSIEHIDLDSSLICITNTLHSQQWQGIEQEYGKKHALFLYLFWLKKMFNLIEVKGRNKKDKAHKKYLLMKKTRPLKDFGIKYLEFEVNKKALHRVFNEGSTKFDKGGRFWGAFYHQLHTEVRECICINGNETVEIDFSGMHIRMLYHRRGQKYTKDPYGIGRKDERSKYKFVSLISINANRKEASGAIFNKLNREGIKYWGGKGSIKKMMDAFMDYHDHIRDVLFTAKGIGLQNLDSKIMEKILMRLLEHGIVGLPVHDSVIVEKQHYDLLYQIMMEEYEKVMGFEPVLK